MSKFVTASQIYPVVGRLTISEKTELGIDPKYLGYQKTVRAILTGEKRPPKKGEFYLSGAIPEAYRAPNDITTPYRICTLVRIEEHISYEITHELISDSEEVGEI